MGGCRRERSQQPQWPRARRKAKAPSRKLRLGLGRRCSLTGRRGSWWWWWWGCRVPSCWWRPHLRPFGRRCVGELREIPLGFNSLLGFEIKKCFRTRVRVGSISDIGQVGGLPELAIRNMIYGGMRFCSLWEVDWTTSAGDFNSSSISLVCPKVG